MVMNGYDTDGDGGNNFYTVNGRSFYYARYPITVRRSETVRIYLANLTEFDLDQLVPPARRLLPLPADRHRRLLGVHRHRDAVPGPARRDRDRLRQHRHVHVPRAPVRVRRARLDGLLQRGRVMEARAPRPVGGLAGGSGRSARSLLLALAVGGFVATGSSLVELIGPNPPPADEFDVRRVEFEPGEIRIRVTNPQQDDLTIASVTVDDAIVPVHARRARATLGRLRSSTIVVPFDWVEDEPIAVGVTSSTGIETVEEIPAAVETPRRRRRGLPRLRDHRLPGRRGARSRSACSGCRRCAAPTPQWLAAFMALTAGLLTFLGVEALSEAFELQAALPGALGGPGLVLLGVAAQLPGDDVHLEPHLRRGGGAPRRRRARDARRDRDRAAQPRRGARDRDVVRVRRARARHVPDRRLHDPQRHRGARDRRARRGRAASRCLVPRLVALALVAGAPAILGAWIGGFVANDVLAVALLRRRRGRGARGRRRGRPLRRTPRARRPHAPAT